MLREFTKCLKCPNISKTPIRSTQYKSATSDPSHFGFHKPNLTFAHSRNFHFSSKIHAKLFTDFENTYAYNLLPPIPKLQPSWNPHNKITTPQDFDKFLDQNWRASNATSIVEAFEKVKDVTVSHNIPLSDSRFDKLVDGLMDHCEKLTDYELLKLLLILLEFPPCEASNSHNFHDVWSCLDDVCCWKMGQWDWSKMFSFADVWYKWNLGRLSEFLYELLDKVTAKPQRLTKNVLIYTFFYLNVCRRKSVPFEFEHVIAQKIDEFSVDELTIIAMGYFKTRSKIKMEKILSTMIRAINENCDTINEISLTAMLKTIRHSQRIETAVEIPPMLDKIIERMERFSHLTLVHVALTGTSLQIKHENSLRKCTEKVLNDIENVRLKDIERMLLACSMFNIDTTPSFFEKALQEILKETRRKEFVQYNRCLPSVLNFLSLRQLYSYDLTNQVLDEDFINETYGKSSKNVPRDLFSLDACIEIECPDYQGSRLSPTKKYKAAKWLTEFSPTPDQPKRLSLPDKLYIEVFDCVKNVIGAELLLRSDHVLPHFSKSDIILCKDKRSGEFVEPFGFENYILGDVKRPIDLENYEWFAVIVMTPSLTVRGASEPLGLMMMKERQLRAVGYKPIFIYSAEFSPLSSPEKALFIKRLLV